jgi:uncharacterized protein YijF (DUF1287 family)
LTHKRRQGLLGGAKSNFCFRIGYPYGDVPANKGVFTDIDLQLFFQRKGNVLPVCDQADDYHPGDGVTWILLLDNGEGTALISNTLVIQSTT